MILSDNGIKDYLDRGRITISPFRKDLLQPCSVDVRLARHFRIFNDHQYTHIDPNLDQPDLTQLVEVGAGDPFVLHPGSFVLGSTIERITLPNFIAAQVNGKSSLGRLGLVVHSTAGFVDAGFSGTITLELSNAATLPIKLWPGMRIGQICFMKLVTPATYPYGSPHWGSKYQGQDGPVASRSYQDQRND